MRGDSIYVSNERVAHSYDDEETTDRR